MKSANKKHSIRRWLDGETDLTASLEMPEPARAEKELHRHEEAPETIPSLERKELKLSARVYSVFSVLFCTVFLGVLIATVSFLPAFGSEESPTVNEVSEHYLAQGRDQTGATNAVAGMILDYRAFDTLGESFVLFTATCAVILLMRDDKKDPPDEREDVVNFGEDVTVRSVAKLLIPIIFVFGIYILLNGHLSPGGGFSGGAILGAGFIIYAMVFGEERASHVLSAKKIRILTMCSLGFYCVAKSYSFFTGNEFNRVESVIGTGTPGDILSAGLILPLNIAVGIVVTCTMYSFYMLFKRGRL